MEGEVADEEEECKLSQGKDELRKQLTTQQGIFVYRSNQQAPECPVLFLLQNRPGRGLDTEEREEDRVARHNLVKGIERNGLARCQCLDCCCSPGCTGLAHGRRDGLSIDAALRAVVA